MIKSLMLGESGDIEQMLTLAHKAELIEDEIDNKLISYSKKCNNLRLKVQCKPSKMSKKLFNSSLYLCFGRRIWRRHTFSHRESDKKSD